jgi:hypothetical protein
VTLCRTTSHRKTSTWPCRGCGGMLRGIGRELTNQRSKMRVLPAPGYTRTYTGKKAILPMPRIGIGVRASLRAAVRFERNGLRLQKLSSANVTAGGNLADARPTFVELWPSKSFLMSRPSRDFQN